MDVRHHANPDEIAWRDAQASKQGLPGLRQALEQRAALNPDLSGFKLRQAPLEGVDLSQRGQQAACSLRGADLYRAHLSHAHLFAVDLREASLMKADLRGANLHCADLRDANLLGVQLDGARLDNVIWGTQVLQERQGRAAAEPTAALDLYQQAEEIYRNLRLHLERAGLFEQAGQFFYREMVMRRLRTPRWSGARLMSWLIDLFCGYGERPLNVVLFSLSQVLCFALAYFALGVAQGEQQIGWSGAQDAATNLLELATCLYYSVVTFTTLGYGDIVPLGWARAVAALEAFVGSFTMALFVVVFVKKMTR